MISFFKKHIVTGAALCIAVSAISPAAVQAEGESSEYDDEIVTFIVQTEYTPAAIVRANRKSSGAKGVRGGDPSTELEKKNETSLSKLPKSLMLTRQTA